ncbi:unnamed protein product [Paramecium pentaurelia]|uniref:Uncharacterized protein n=1 Tax=Paramecium pentaurelia TaxID=43138 RepID=A0A8S1VY08_9CILI|nr:unnamed protein product [Paramecium pentaurelia]
MVISIILNVNEMCHCSQLIDENDCTKSALQCSWDFCSQKCQKNHVQRSHILPLAYSNYRDVFRLMVYAKALPIARSLKDHLNLVASIKKFIVRLQKAPIVNLQIISKIVHPLLLQIIVTITIQLKDYVSEMGKNALNLHLVLNYLIVYILFVI